MASSATRNINIASNSWIRKKQIYIQNLIQQVESIAFITKTLGFAISLERFK